MIVLSHSCPAHTLLVSGSGRSAESDKRNLKNGGVKSLRLAHTFNSSLQEAEADESGEFKASPVYSLSSGTAGATQRSPVMNMSQACCSKYVTLKQEGSQV